MYISNICTLLLLTSTRKVAMEAATAQLKSQKYTLHIYLIVFVLHRLN